MAAALALMLHTALLDPAGLRAQEPDSTPRDLPPRSQAADTASSDTSAVEAFPLFPEPARRLGVLAEWGLADLLGSGALSFADLVEFLPPFDPVRAGALAGPQAALFAGRGAASLRFSDDGYEIAPLLGGPLDLHLISLAEQESIRLVAEPGGYHAYARTYRRERAQAYSRIEAGTGNRGTNLLRAFLSSRVSDAAVGFGFDRIDSGGDAQTGGSERTVVWANLAQRMPWGAWGQLEYRRTTVDRDSFPNPKRTDWVLRLRRRWESGVTADLVAGRASLKREPVDGSAPSDSLAPAAEERTARQLALRGARTGERWQAYFSVRLWDGEGVPDVESQGSIELEAGPAALYASGTYAYWGSGLHTAGGFGSVAVQLPLGLLLVAEAEEGDRGVFGFRPIGWMEYGRWSLGLGAGVGSWRLNVRGGRWRTRPSPALGEPIDSLTSRPGGTVSVGEVRVWGRLFRLLGGAVQAAGRYRVREDGPFLYWPKDAWRVEGVYHLRALGDQLEVLLSGMGGVRGPMVVGDRALGSSALVSTGDLTWWRAEAVVRIKDVDLYYNYEFFDSVGVLGELPGFPLPPTRFHFGVKWQFWN